MLALRGCGLMPRFTTIRRRIGTLRTCIPIATLTLACGTDPVATPEVMVRINELSSSNRDFRDENGATPDWIELINLGDEPADLAGDYVSDTANNPLKVKLTGSVVVPAKGLLLLWADGQTNGGDTHIAFNLSSKGDGFCLSDPKGYVLDCIEFSAIPPNDANGDDTSLARFPDGTGPFQWCSRYSPGEHNGDHCAGESL